METFPGRSSEMRLYTPARQRLYINADERPRFLAAAGAAPPPVRAFCLTLLYTGCRLSESLALSPSALQPEAQVLTFTTLKRRRPGVFHEIPVPRTLVEQLLTQCAVRAIATDAPLWTHHGHPLNRSTGYH